MGFGEVYEPKVSVVKRFTKYIVYFYINSYEK